MLIEVLLTKICSFISIKCITKTIKRIDKSMLAKYMVSSKGKYTWFCLIGAKFWVNPVNGSENNFGQ